MRSLYPRLRLARVGLEDPHLEVAHRYTRLCQIPLYPVLYLRFDALCVLFGPDAGSDIDLGSRPPLGLGLYVRLEHLGLLLDHRSDLALDGAPGDVCSPLHPYSPGGRRFQLEDEQHQPQERDGAQDDDVERADVAALHVTDVASQTLVKAAQPKIIRQVLELVGS